MSEGGFGGMFRKREKKGGDEATNEGFKVASLEEVRAAYNALEGREGMARYPVIRIEAQDEEGGAPIWSRPDYMNQPVPGKPFTLTAPLNFITKGENLFGGRDRDPLPGDGDNTEYLVLHGGLGFGRGPFAWIPVTAIKKLELQKEGPKSVHQEEVAAFLPTLKMLAGESYQHNAADEEVRGFVATEFERTYPEDTIRMNEVLMRLEEKGVTSGNDPIVAALAEYAKAYHIKEAVKVGHLFNRNSDRFNISESELKIDEDTARKNLADAQHRLREIVNQYDQLLSGAH